MQSLKPSEVRRISTNGSSVRERIGINKVVGSQFNSTTGGPNDYRDFINYKPGDEMLNSDLPGLRA